MDVIFTPKNLVSKEQKNSGGDDFWPKVWDSEDQEIKQEYNARLDKLKNIVDLVSSEETASIANKKYIQITLDERAKSKTSSPQKLWDTSHFKAISSGLNNKVIISGEQRAVEDLQRILNNANYEKALFPSEDVRRIDKNIYREIFAVKSAATYTKKYTERIEASLNEKMRQSTRTDFSCILEIAAGISFDLYDLYYNKLVEIVNDNLIEKIDRKYFINNMYFKIRLNETTTKRILKDSAFDDVRFIYAERIPTSQRSLPNLEHMSFQIGRTKTNETLGIFDSGIDSPATLNSLVTQKENFLETHQFIDNEHGTFVASRAIYGDNIKEVFESPIARPISKLLDIMVLYKDGDFTKADNIKLRDAIQEIPHRHPNIKIYNFSINYRYPVQNDIIDDLTAYIDKYSRDYDILFICSTGNYDDWEDNSSYEEIFRQQESMVATPGDASNVLTVGSIAKIADTSTFCPRSSYPSPFTRGATTRKYLVKPDLVDFGGNVAKGINRDDSNRRYGVQGILGNQISTDIGTSYSTPLVARQAIIALDYLNKSNIRDFLTLDKNYANAIKAMVIHSATLKSIDVQDESIKSFIGYGVPNIARLLNPEGSEITIIYSDIITPSEKKHIMKIQLPQELVGKKVEFILTCVYNPPVDKNFVEKYNRIELTTNVRFLVATDPKNKYASLSPCPKYLFNKDKRNNVIHIRGTKRSIPSSQMEILTEMTAEDGAQNENQSYTWLLTLRSSDPSINVRDLLLNNNQVSTINKQQVIVRV